MKRLTYISRLAQPLNVEQIDDLGERAWKYNHREGITGVLVFSSGVFYQVLEGDEEPIDRLFTKIRQDPRHMDILVLKTDYNISERSYPDWSMKSINLDEDSDALMKPIRSMFQVLADTNSILGKYTQSAVLNFIDNGINPLETPSRFVEKTILFCDIVAFSQFSTTLNVQAVVELLNNYLSVCTTIISGHGGEVTKYIGDCVMAYFDYENTEAAVQSAMDILAALEQRRADAPLDSPQRVLYSAFGLAGGEVIEGNIGSLRKMDYTVLGEAVNKAEALEGLTRELPRSIAFSAEIKKRLNDSHWQIIPFGRHILKPNQPQVPVYSIDDPLTVKPANTTHIIERMQHVLDEIKALKAQTP